MSFAETWARFCAQEHTLGPSPGVRAQWHQGRQRYAVWLLRLRDPQLTARVQTVADALGDHIRPISATDLHVTLFVAGFPTDRPSLDDDVGWPVLHRQRARLNFPAFPIEIGAANSFSTAAFLEVWDLAGGIARVRSQLAGEGSELRFAAYQPHVTVGTYGRSEDTRPIRETLQRWRAAPRVRVAVSSVELVTFDATTAGSALETVFSVSCVTGTG